MSKILVAREILQVMEFFGIPSEKFEDLKNQHGGLYELHAYFESQF